MKSPGSKIKKLCKELGEAYSIKVIDLENVIYRDLGNGYDFEVGGLDNSGSKFNATLFIWEKAIGLFTVETITGIRSYVDLVEILNSKAIEYRNRPHTHP